jgi:hypothetical protein
MTSPAHHWVPADTIFFFVNTKAKLAPGAGVGLTRCLASEKEMFSVVLRRWISLSSSHLGQFLLKAVCSPEQFTQQAFWKEGNCCFTAHQH